MSNGRDDRTDLNFTVADRVKLASIDERSTRIEEKLDEVLNIKTQVNKNGVWIKAIIWVMGFISLSTLAATAQAFGLFG